MNHVISLASGGTYDITSDRGAILALEIHNDDGGSNVYYGIRDTTGTEILYSEVHGPIAVTSGSPNIVLSNRVPEAIRQGYVLSSGSAAALFAADAVVLSVNENTIVMDSNATGSEADADAEFTPPTLDSTNGIPIAAGTCKSFTSAEENRLIQRGIRLRTATGETATVRIHKIIA